MKFTKLNDIKRPGKKNEIIGYKFKIGQYVGRVNRMYDGRVKLEHNDGCVEFFNNVKEFQLLGIRGLYELMKKQKDLAKFIYRNS